MTNPWVISKIAHPLTPDRDIDPHGPKHDAQYFDTLIGNYITKVNAVLERQILPGVTIYKGIACVPFLESMHAKRTRVSGDVLKNQVHPSSVDALASFARNWKRSTRFGTWWKSVERERFLKE